ncbi:unnamed protein product [Urochloa humidicola]
MTTPSSSPRHQAEGQRLDSVPAVRALPAGLAEHEEGDIAAAVPRPRRRRRPRREHHHRDAYVEPDRAASSPRSLTSPRPRLVFNEPLGPPEDPDYFDDVDYAEEEDNDNTPGVHTHIIILTY